MISRSRPREPDQSNLDHLGEGTRLALVPCDDFGPRLPWETRAVIGSTTGATSRGAAFRAGW